MCGRWLIVAAVLPLAGCFSAFDQTRGQYSSSTDNSAGGASGRTASAHGGARAASGQYAVVGGDTLYSIAFRNQLDFHELAAWNHIDGPDYRIYPGRVLRLTPPGGGAGPAVAAHAEPPQAAARPAVPPARPAPPPAAAPNVRAPVPPAAEIAAVPPEEVNASVPPDTAPPPKLPPPVPPVGADVAKPRPAAGRWQWPTQGAVARAFGVDGNKGLDLSGTLGQPVLASAPGKVVYSGSALKGYGELVILQHDEQYLSAYGFNQRRLVKEGDIVAAGQQIAELGLGPEQKPDLHFEIRDRGKPVDPAAMLPRR